MSQRIEIRISPQGESQLVTKGFTGGNCRDASRWLEVALGDRKSETMTAEYYRISSTDQQQHTEESS